MDMDKVRLGILVDMDMDKFFVGILVATPSRLVISQVVAHRWQKQQQGW